MKTTHLTSASKDFVLVQRTEWHGPVVHGEKEVDTLRAIQMPKKHRVHVQNLALLSMFIYQDAVLVKVSKRTALNPATHKAVKLKKDMLVTPVQSSLHYAGLPMISAAKESDKVKTKKKTPTPVASDAEMQADSKEQISN